MARWFGAEQMIGQGASARTPDMLRRWRRRLAMIEVEAARHSCAEVQLLAGMAGLAVDDLIEDD